MFAHGSPSEQGSHHHGAAHSADDRRRERDCLSQCPVSVRLGERKYKRVTVLSRKGATPPHSDTAGPEHGGPQWPIVVYE